MEQYAALNTTQSKRHHVCLDNNTSINSAPLFKINKDVSDITTKKPKDYYTLLITKNACFPNYSRKLKINFNLSDEEVRQGFLLPYSPLAHLP